LVERGERAYAALAAGLLKPVTADSVAEEKRHPLDRLDQASWPISMQS
jgi:hypothetical protein